jgi:hypothetical protein
MLRQTAHPNGKKATYRRPLRRRNESPPKKILFAPAIGRCWYLFLLIAAIVSLRTQRKVRRFITGVSRHGKTSFRHKSTRKDTFSVRRTEGVSLQVTRVVRFPSFRLKVAGFFHEVPCTPGRLLRLRLTGEISFLRFLCRWIRRAKPSAERLAALCLSCRVEIRLPRGCSMPGRIAN